MTPAISYERFSPRPDEDTSASNEVQLQYNQAYCREKGYVWEKSFQDDAVSGGDPKRQGYWDALEYLRRGMVLVTYKMDRIARGVLITLDTERIVRKAGARIECVIGINTDDTPEGRLYRTIIAAFDEYRKDSDAARTSAFMRRHQSNGRAMSSRPPYGWRDGESVMVPHPKRQGEMVARRMLEPDPVEQAVVERIRALGKEMGAFKIARIATEQGWPCRGTRWHAATVQRILERV